MIRKTRQKEKHPSSKRIRIPSPTDPQGSYTGVPEDPKEVPVQDVDDL